MRKLIPICLAVSLFPYLTACWPGLAVGRDQEELTYRGKPLAEWVNTLGDKSPHARSKAILRLSEAVSAQLEDDRDWDHASQVVPVLMKALGDEHAAVRAEAARALYKFNIGPAADAEVERLIKMLGDKDAEVRYDAANELRLLLPAAKAAAPALTEALIDPDSSVRRRAALTLGMLGPDGKAAVPLLVETLKSDPDLILGVIPNFGRMEAAIALGSIGPDAKAAVQVLEEALRDKFPWVRQQAALALARIGAAARPALPALRELLKDDSKEVRACATLALWQLSRDIKEALPGLREALRIYVRPGPAEIEFSTINLVSKAIAEMGQDAREAVPELLPLLRDKYCRRSALESLKKIDPEAAKKGGLR